MDEVVVSTEQFNARIARLISQWRADKKGNDTLAGGADSIIFVLGKSDESGTFQKTNSLQYWLLGYEFPATLFLVTLDKCYILTSGKKGKPMLSLRHSEGCIR